MCRREMQNTSSEVPQEEAPPTLEIGPAHLRGSPAHPAPHLVRPGREGQPLELGARSNHEMNVNELRQQMLPRLTLTPVESGL